MRNMTLLFKKIMGINNKLPEYDLSKDEFKGTVIETETFLTDASNVDITDELHYRRRQGTEKKISGNIHSIWSDGTVCLFRQSDQLNMLFPDFSFVTLRSGMTTKRIYTRYTKIIDSIYYSDGLTGGGGKECTV